MWWEEAIACGLQLIVCQFVCDEINVDAEGCSVVDMTVSSGCRSRTGFITGRAIVGDVIAPSCFSIDGSISVVNVCINPFIIGSVPRMNVLIEGGVSA